jgi:hypothetical protein
MTKRSKALTNALALYRCSKEYDKLTHSNNGVCTLTFWFPGGPKIFKSGQEARNFVNKIVKKYK